MRSNAASAARCTPFQPTNESAKTIVKLLFAPVLNLLEQLTILHTGPNDTVSSGTAMNRVIGYEVRYGLVGVALISLELQNSGWTAPFQVDATELAPLISLLETRRAWFNPEDREIRVKRTASDDILGDPNDPADPPV